MAWGGAGSPNYIVDPTMAELEAHTAAGLEFVSSNPAAAEANMMLLSAWNEHDEGHWIAPALEKYGGAEKLEAIKKAIDKAAARRRRYWAQVTDEVEEGEEGEKAK